MEVYVYIDVLCIENICFQPGKWSQEQLKTVDQLTVK